jgi:hypothetical protein
VVCLQGMALPPREKQYIVNWQLSIIGAVRNHDLEFVWCLRLISWIMMPNSAPPIDMAEHAKQADYSDMDKEALVVWIKVLEDMAGTGDRELCNRFKEACTEVFASQGFPDMMVDGPLVKPPAPRDGVEGQTSLREKLIRAAQGLPSEPAMPSTHGVGAQALGEPEPNLGMDKEAAGRSFRAEKLQPDRPARLSLPIWKAMKAKRYLTPRDHGEEALWHWRAQTVLEDILGGPLRVDDIIYFFANHDPSPAQTALLSRFIAEEGDPVEIMTKLLEELHTAAQLPE